MAEASLQRFAVAELPRASSSRSTNQQSACFLLVARTGLARGPSSNSSGWTLTAFDYSVVISGSPQITTRAKPKQRGQTRFLRKAAKV